VASSFNDQIRISSVPSELLWFHSPDCLWTNYSRLEVRRRAAKV